MIDAPDPRPAELRPPDLSGETISIPVAASAMREIVFHGGPLDGRSINAAETYWLYDDESWYRYHFDGHAYYYGPRRRI